jgi:heptosyltransferase-3
MFSKLSKNSPVKNILVITLSNIGDAVLTAPVMDVLLRDFPSAKLSIVTSEKCASLFEGNPRINRIHLFDKHSYFLDQAKWTLDLRRYHYDLVVDLRNSMIPYFLSPKWLTSPFIEKGDLHLKDQHLKRLRSLYDFSEGSASKLAIAPSSSDEQKVEGLLHGFLGQSSSFILIAPFAQDSAKTWPSSEFAKLSRALYEKYHLKIVMIGSGQQKQEIDQIIAWAQVPILSLPGQTNLIQIAALIKRATIVIVHDSGPMHIASYFNKPIVALFGPTDPHYSKPWSTKERVLRSHENCQRCLNPKLLNVPHNCMSGISVQEVLIAFEEVYGQI